MAATTVVLLQQVHNNLLKIIILESCVQRGDSIHPYTHISIVVRTFGFEGEKSLVTFLYTVNFPVLPNFCTLTSTNGLPPLLPVRIRLTMCARRVSFPFMHARVERCSF